MKTIKISEETYEKIKDQINETDMEINSLENLVGKKWFFRLIPFHVVGRVVKVIGNIVELEGASWVADSGRFMNAIKEGKLNEVEPTGKAFINIDSVCDFYPWNFDLPEEQK